MEQLAVTGLICFLVGGVFGWFLRMKWKEIKGTMGPEFDRAMDKLKKELKEAKDELDKYRNK